MSNELLTQLVPVLLAIIAVVKIYVELRYTRRERDAVIRGVERFRDIHVDGDYLKARIKYETTRAEIEDRVKKSVSKVRKDMK